MRIRIAPERGCVVLDQPQIPTKGRLSFLLPRNPVSNSFFWQTSLFWKILCTSRTSSFGSLAARCHQEQCRIYSNDCEMAKLLRLVEDDTAAVHFNFGVRQKPLLEISVNNFLLAQSIFCGFLIDHDPYSVSEYISLNWAKHGQVHTQDQFDESFGKYHQV